MSLVKCPSCRNKISSKVKSCPHCSFSFDQDEIEIERIKLIKYRKYRDLVYKLKMLSYLAVVIAMIGIVPMIWDYTQAINYGFIVSISDHWGLYFLELGFVFYIIVRYLLIKAKRQYKSNK